MSVPQSQKPDTEPKRKPNGRLYAVTPETESIALRSVGADNASGHRGRRPEAVSDCDGDVACTSTNLANPTRNVSMLPHFAAAFAVRFGGVAAATECPKHIADTQACIDRISTNMVSDEDRMPGDMVELVYALLDDARMFLGAARRNHEEPQGAYDHARAFAKADAALGHSRAAEILHSRFARPRRVARARCTRAGSPRCRRSHAASAGLRRRSPARSWQGCRHRCWP